MMTRFLALMRINMTDSGHFGQQTHTLYKQVRKEDAGSENWQCCCMMNMMMMMKLSRCEKQEGLLCGYIMMTIMILMLVMTVIMMKLDRREKQEGLLCERHKGSLC